jgi:FkbH-like protein
MSSTIIEFPPRRLGSTASSSITIEEITDWAIEAAPDCVRRRVILQAIDWSAVAPDKVRILLATLEQAHVAMPKWLSELLLLAGHVLPEEIESHLPLALATLNRLNGATGEAHERDAVSGALEALAHNDRLDQGVATALLERLLALSWDEEATRLGLAQGRRVRGTLRHIGKLLDTHVKRLPALRIRLAGSSNTHTLAEELVPALAATGWRADVTQADFGGAVAELLQPPGDIDVLIVLLDLLGFAPIDWRRPATDAIRTLEERAELLAKALAEYSARPSAPLLINTIPAGPAPTAGLLDRRHASGLGRAIDLINRTIQDGAERSERIFVVDSDQALGDLPLREQVDPRLWYYGRFPYSADATRDLARAFAQAWDLLRRGPAKVLAVDLDNTMWGGIYGDDGEERLACGEDFPGNAYRAMQEECLRLKGQGVLLVALSKNEPDALEVLARHPGMLLRPDDFAASAVNWDPKPDNIRRIAAKLNLGLDSFVFLDDSPHERDAMRRLCPEVRVPEMPADPAERPLWLRRLACTWPLRLTAEDEDRTSLYAASGKARELEAVSASLDDYLLGLEQKLTLAPVSKTTLARVAQMHQRTNQFNLTTLRSTEAEIAALVEDEKVGLALLGHVTDRFGDHGIVIASTVSINGKEAVILSLLMSCRVIGREIERAFAGELLRDLERRGVTRVVGEYLPTPKNAMVRDFYASCGFSLLETAETATRWVFEFGRSKRPESRFVAVAWER